jgi:hypothetical protein
MRDRHLKFHEDRDNLGFREHNDLLFRYTNYTGHTHAIQTGSDASLEILSRPVDEVLRVSQDEVVSGDLRFG